MYIVDVLDDASDSCGGRAVSDANVDGTKSGRVPFQYVRLNAHR